MFTLSWLPPEVAAAAAAAATGASACAALIAAIGAQNAWVLRQGLRRAHVGWVVAICSASDALLIQAGVWGLGSLLARMPGLETVMRLAGAAFLLAYAGQAARRAWVPQHAALQADAQGQGQRLSQVVLTTLALTWLNPHVYLDTVLLLGSVAAPFQGGARVAFALGATAVSVLWFVALGQGARALAPWLARPALWRGLDAAMALLMAALAVGLLWPWLVATA